MATTVLPMTPATISSETGRPLRVAYVISAFQTAQAGTEGHLLRLIRQIDRRSVDPHLIVMQDSDWTRSFHDPLVPLSTLGFRAFWNPRDWGCIGRLARMFRTIQADVVELHATDAHFAGSLAARWARVPVVISCRRDLGHQLTWKDRLLHRIGNRLVDSFLANSQEVISHFRRTEGITASSFQLIHNGLDLDQFDRSAAGPVRGDLAEVWTRGPVIVISANLRPVKDHPTLLRAFQLVRQRVPDCQLLMLGSGEELESLQRLASELGIAKQVLWAGSVPEVAPYLRRSTVGCLSSRTEGFSNALMEYMAAALPVVATRTGGAMETVVDGRTGWLVDPGDAPNLAQRLIDVLSDPAEGRAMGIHGRHRIESLFTQSVQLDKYCRLYHDLYQHHRRSS